MKKEYLQPIVERISLVGKSNVCQDPFDDPGVILPPVILGASPTP